MDEFKQSILKNQIVNPEVDVAIEDSLMRRSCEEDTLLLMSEQIFAPKDTVIIQRNTKQTHFYYIVSGTVCMRNEEEEALEFDAGDFFGLHALFTEGKKPLDTVAKEDCILFRVNVPEFIKLVYHGHYGAMSLMETLGNLTMQRLNLLDRVVQTKGLDEETIQDSYEEKQRVLKQWSLRYHAFGHKGKLEIRPTKQVGSPEDLSVAYSPGVAEPCIMM